MALRIGGGGARGRRLRAAGKTTRPPLARVRTSLMDTLAGRLEGARVLDVYAGSGSLGFEALSRGAAECVFVESDAAAVAGIRADAAALGLEKNARVVRGDVAAGLAALVADDGTGFDVVFLDPPFKVDAAAVAEEAAVLVARLGVLVWRVPRGRVLPPRVGVLALTRQRRYGISKVGSYT
ncbi:MAG: 16S rRNA (guanine(966)-N(2))-methyltransferase RsmD [bacterium]